VWRVAQLVVDYFAMTGSALRALRLEPFFPILGERYKQVHSEGRKAILGRIQPGPLPLRWPPPVHGAFWLARGAEEALQGLLRALAVWRGTCPERLVLLVRALCAPRVRLVWPLLLLWLLRRRVAGRRRPQLLR
jgi:hypothetical protein